MFRHEATGAGVVMVIARACERLGWNLAEQRCVVQGFGNVGGIAAQELVERGAHGRRALGRVGRLRTTRHGLDIPTMSHFAREHGSLEGWDRGDADRRRGGARARLRHPRARRARGSGARRQRAAPPLPDGRRGRERADLARGRRDPARARDPGAARHPHERRRRHRLVLRVGAGPRPALLGPRRDPLAPRREAERRVRPRLGHRRRARHLRCAPPRSSPGSATSRPRSTRGGCTREQGAGRDDHRAAVAAGDRLGAGGGAGPHARRGAGRVRRRRGRRAARRRHAEDARRRGRRRGPRSAHDDPRARSPRRRTTPSTRSSGSRRPSTSSRRPTPSACRWSRRAG